MGSRQAVWVFSSAQDHGFEHDVLRDSVLELLRENVELCKQLHVLPCEARGDLVRRSMQYSEAIGVQQMNVAFERIRVVLW